MTKQQLREAIRRIIKQELSEGTKTVSNPNAGKWRIVTADKREKPLTDKFYDSKAEAEKASEKIGKINAPGMKIIQLKDTMKIHEAPYPAIADPDTEEDVETDPLISPDEDDDLNVGGDPDTIPKVNPQAEKRMLQKILARYKTSLNEKKNKK